MYLVDTNVIAEARRSTPPSAQADGLIAAAAIVHDFIVVTRNVDDFIDMGATVVTPSMPSGPGEVFDRRDPQCHFIRPGR